MDPGIPCRVAVLRGALRGVPSGRIQGFFPVKIFL